jgi:hypothetical protein
MSEQENKPTEKFKPAFIPPEGLSTEGVFEDVPDFTIDDIEQLSDPEVDEDEAEIAQKRSELLKDLSEYAELALGVGNQIDSVREDANRFFMTTRRRVNDLANQTYERTRQLDISPQHAIEDLTRKVQQIKQDIDRYQDASDIQSNIGRAADTIVEATGLNKREIRASEGALDSDTEIAAIRHAETINQISIDTVGLLTRCIQDGTGESSNILKRMVAMLEDIHFPRHPDEHPNVLHDAFRACFRYLPAAEDVLYDTERKTSENSQSSENLMQLRHVSRQLAELADQPRQTTRTTLASMFK